MWLVGFGKASEEGYFPRPLEAEQKGTVLVSVSGFESTFPVKIKTGQGFLPARRFPSNCEIRCIT